MLELATLCHETATRPCGSVVPWSSNCLLIVSDSVAQLKSAGRLLTLSNCLATQ